MLYVVLYGAMDHIAVIDVEGNNLKVIPTLVQDGEEDSWLKCDYLGYSQECLLSISIIWMKTIVIPDFYAKAMSGATPGG
jgi:hypothetical protein